MISTPRDGLVSWRDPQSIYFKLNKEDEYKLVIVRSQPFAAPGASVLPERVIIQSFVEKLAEIAEFLDGPLGHDLLSSFQRRVVSSALARGEEFGTILSAIDQLAHWGGRLYEGMPISAAIGFRQGPRPRNTVSLADIATDDFAAVLSNGHDTILEFNFAGQLYGHRALTLDVSAESYCPFRYAPVGHWTSEDEHDLSLVLNRLGEILIFREGQLIFARRAGRWHFLTHEPVLKQMATPKRQDVREAIYETCLDASFARTGACMGVVSSGSHVGKVVAKSDLISNAENTKTKTIAKILKKRKFNALDRRLRQELVAIDGATIISHSGDVLAVGAIVKVPGGSAGGGRLAASKQIAKLGLGIKVSQDGGITGFKKGKGTPAFKVM